MSEQQEIEEVKREIAHLKFKIDEAERQVQAQIKIGNQNREIARALFAEVDQSAKLIEMQSADRQTQVHSLNDQIQEQFKRGQNEKQKLMNQIEAANKKLQDAQAELMAKSERATTISEESKKIAMRIDKISFELTHTQNAMVELEKMKVEDTSKYLEQFKMLAEQHKKQAEQKEQQIDELECKYFCFRDKVWDNARTCLILVDIKEVLTKLVEYYKNK